MNTCFINPIKPTLEVLLYAIFLTRVGGLWVDELGLSYCRNKIEVAAFDRDVESSIEKHIDRLKAMDQRVFEM